LGYTILDRIIQGEVGAQSYDLTEEPIRRRYSDADIRDLGRNFRRLLGVTWARPKSGAPKS